MRDFFPDEAAALGVLTILWNRQELALRRLFLQILASQRRAFAEAIWERQPTHQARRDLLALALHTVKMTKRQRAFLRHVVDKTKDIADRRNELMHAEYVVHGRTDTLHARVKAPRSTKPPKHQRAGVKDLEIVIANLEELLDATEAAWLEFVPRRMKRLLKGLKAAAESLQPSHGNRQTYSDLPSLRRIHDAEF